MSKKKYIHKQGEDGNIYRIINPDYRELNRKMLTIILVGGAVLITLSFFLLRSYKTMTRQNLENEREIEALKEKVDNGGDVGEIYIDEPVAESVSDSEDGAQVEDIPIRKDTQVLEQELVITPVVLKKALYIRSIDQTLQCDTDALSYVKDVDDDYIEDKKEYDDCVSDLKKKMDEEAAKSEQSRSQCLDACIKSNYEYPERVSPCFTDCSNTHLSVLKTKLDAMEDDCDYLETRLDQVWRVVNLYCSN